MATSLFRLSARGRTSVTPSPNAAGVNVNESRPRVVADSASLQMQCGVPQHQRIHAGNADVDRMRLHVETIFGYTRRTRAKKLITPGGPVSTNNVDLRAGMPNGRGQIGKDVKDVRIVMLHFAGAMIPKKMIKLIFGFRKILVASAIHDVDALASMRMVETKAMLVARRGGRYVAICRNACAKEEASAGQ